MSENLFKPNCLRTHSGRYVNLLDPQLEDIYPHDIAVGLSRAARFAGHTVNFYSVAQHSDWCRQQCELMFPGNHLLAFKVMMHDAHEYLLCDIPSPLKNLMPEYDFIADKLQAIIHQRFGIYLLPGEAEIIKQIDALALQWEWDNKVLVSTGLRLNDAINVDLFIENFTRLCRHPYAIK